MTIVKNAVAGTLESSDLYVEVSPTSDGNVIEIESVVINRFGEEIRAVVFQVLEELGVGNARVVISDKGALECVIRARVETALRRAGEVSI